MTKIFSRLPVDGGVITGGFNEDYGSYRHRGIDFGELPIGTPIYAPGSGVVSEFLNSWTIWNGVRVQSFGNAVCIDHGEGLEFRYSLYAHMNEVLVSPGQMVEAGDLIGYLGNTGVSTGAHLHWQLCKNPSFPTDISYSADPLLFLEKEMTETEVRNLIRELQNSGALASTTDVLSCIAQIVGAEENTYSDKERIAKVRETIRTLATATEE